MKSSSETLAYFADLIFQELGIIYQEANFYQLDTRLSEVASSLGYESSNELFLSAKKSFTPKMRKLLLDAATNNETLFFRDPVVFENIQKNLINKMQLAPERVEPLRIWSAACSYGQEVYTLAMVMESIKETLPKEKYEILATDISERALSSASEGRYNQLQINRGLPADMRAQYFEQEGDNPDNSQWKIKSFLKNNISFKKLNLTEPFGSIGQFDLILCRNVLIYQSSESKQDIIHRIYDRLNPGGVLIMGAAESLIGITDKFDILKMKRATFFQKPLAELQKSA